jgi:uncharacterized RDD family membrane protein YckC
MESSKVRFFILCGLTVAFFMVFGRILRVTPGLGIPTGPIPVGPVGRPRRRRRG